MHRRNSIRVRLALWFSAAYAVMLGLFAIGAYVFLRTSGLARIDEFLQETADAVARAIDFERSAGRGDSAAVATVVEAFRMRDIDVLVLDLLSGSTLRASQAQNGGAVSGRVSLVPAIPDVGTLLAEAPAAATFRTVRSGNDELRVFIEPHRVGRRALRIATVRSLQSYHKSLRQAELALALGIPLLVTLATGGGYVLARASLRPVAQMTERAASISASSLHERLPVANPGDELGRLALVFNDLLDRLQTAFEEQRRFMADASHELRTPVAVIGGESDLALARPDRPPESLREALSVVRSEARRLRRIVDDLFLLARGEEGSHVLKVEELYLSDLIQECVRAMQSVAERQGVAVEFGSDGSDISVAGDESLLRRLIMNLLDNAVKYTPPNGRVAVSVRVRDGRILVDIADTGVGIAPEDQPRIFERFYRGRLRSASGAREGAGLGLAIARWVARAHGGDVVLLRSGGQGSVFRVELPLEGDRRGAGRA
jgi:two-component system OmpR family sensor kinase